MNLDQLLQAGVHSADLQTADAHFSSIGIGDLTGILHLKSALVSLANLTEFENTIKPTYKEDPRPSVVFRPLKKNLEFSKYLRNKFVGHIHPDLIAKAIEWQPMLRRVASSLDDPKAMLVVNIWILETAINTYVQADGAHKVFDSETDLMYQPDWQRFLNFLEVTIRGGIDYLKLLNFIWVPKLLPASQGSFDLGLAIKAGKAEFKFLSQ